MKIDEHDNLVSCNLLCPFPNVPVDETVEIPVEKVFKDALFNKEYDLNITKTDLIELLEVATKKPAFLIRRKFVRTSGRGCYGLSSLAAHGKCIYVQYQRTIDKPKQDACFL